MSRFSASTTARSTAEKTTRTGGEGDAVPGRPGVRAGSSRRASAGGRRRSRRRGFHPRPAPVKHEVPDAQHDHGDLERHHAQAGPAVAPAEREQPLDQRPVGRLGRSGGKRGHDNEAPRPGGGQPASLQVFAADCKTLYAPAARIIQQSLQRAVHTRNEPVPGHELLRPFARGDRWRPSGSLSTKARTFSAVTSG